MAAITWKCPNCGGELVFEPSLQKYQCPYCVSTFTQEELEEMNPVESAEHSPEPETTAAEENHQEGPDPAEADHAGEAALYSCPSCGAEIITDATTAATFCYYCHNPVVLEGRLSGDFLPDQIIPFQIDRETAVKKFGEFIGKKRFVPKAFYNESQIEKLTGVYYPYWCYDGVVDADMVGEGSKIRVWRSGDTQFTETTVYQIERKGTVAMKNMMAHALKKSDRLLVENVQPFDLKERKPFSMSYLSGFVAEKRDMENSEFSASMQEKMKDYANQLVRDTIGGYTNTRVSASRMDTVAERWSYLLLPVWVLTYRDSSNQTYYFAMNGQTGNIAGVLPVDTKKLGMYSALTGIAIAAVCILGGLLI